MKRRSPWLTFAACVLLRGGSAYSEPATKPALSISSAAVAAESELAKRGLAGDHVVASVSLIRSAGKPAYYSVRIDPPLPAGSSSKAEETYGFHVAMTGDISLVALAEEALRGRVRVPNSTPN
jgi:hypothetical protein